MLEPMKADDSDDSLAGIMSEVEIERWALLAAHMTKPVSSVDAPTVLLGEDEALEHAARMVRHFQDVIALHSMETEGVHQRQAADLLALANWECRLEARQAMRGNVAAAIRQT